ncbi:23S rRNA (adenine(2030)-N(6))-methyltransferase RlmJ [Marinobacter orientalis]|uniref:Ribosomal RNA large subunit methyltransferase J n=1 Tax=Marinobacter orientalis TaxID=1928859 RepID=A0A7Y0WT37_9GAMM|nr:23S rRNA (adenine(2030)-N(6))-methyltransferase RlmJ [Marinobacter orientalis]NMT64538.1 23S rRNA (adenine(2030)-N(6))-methyltransferase RlmJ [Marinobacter orientalis]TGX50509.1 23S rRNA (adenine(2030)-N(6))-methyltransferase RlmJ [Marinobacter orientalis]
MLSYLHAFHAGNFADIQKHAALALTLTMMQSKKTGIACFDTHAGSAIYDLRSERARKTAEADRGVQRLWKARDQLRADDWKPVLDVLEQFNADDAELGIYPGSPAWFRHFLRPGDDLTLFELHPSESEQLADWASAGRVRVLRQDGLAGLLSQLPPKQPRLLSLIDPSYEIKSDYIDVAQALGKAWQKCRHGIYLVWYPVLTSGFQEQLKEAIRATAVRKVLCSEVHLRTPPERGMTGSGMLVVNPPWGFDRRLTAMMDDVAGRDCLDITLMMDWLVAE